MRRDHFFDIHQGLGVLWLATISAKYGEGCEVDALFLTSDRTDAVVDHMECRLVASDWIMRRVFTGFLSLINLG